MYITKRKDFTVGFAIDMQDIHSRGLITLSALHQSLSGRKEPASQTG
jgi:hypothetical protein